MFISSCFFFFFFSGEFQPMETASDDEETIEKEELEAGDDEVSLNCNLGSYTNDHPPYLDLLGAPGLYKIKKRR